MRDMAEKKKEHAEKQKQALRDLRVSCQRIFSTPDGKVVARALMKFCGLYRFPKTSDEKDRGKEEVYLYFIKQMLEPEQLLTIERGDVNEKK